MSEIRKNPNEVDIMRILKINKNKSSFIGIMMITILWCCNSQVQASQSGDYIPVTTRIIGYTTYIANDYAKKYNRQFATINTGTVSVTGVSLNKSSTIVVGANET